MKCRKPTPPPLAQEGDICEGFDESTGMPFPSCAPGLECQDSGLVSIGGSAGNRCVKPLAQEGETCGGFNEFTGMSFPDCAPGLECVDSGLVSIGGGGSNVCQIPTPPTP